MYYLNSDGSLDKTTLISDIPAESTVSASLTNDGADDNYRGCNCNICSRKRKKRSIYPRWLSWTNIIIFLLLIGVIIMIFSGNKIFNLFTNNTTSSAVTPSNKIMPPPPLPPQTPTAESSGSGSTDFELPLL